jgi:hypothetical protein
MWTLPEEDLGRFGKICQGSMDKLKLVKKVLWHFPKIFSQCHRTDSKREYSVVTHAVITY